MRTGVHEREAGGDPRRGGRPPATRIRARRLANELTKRGAEGTEAPEADGEADLRNGEPRVPQELFRTLDAAPQEVLMGRLAESLLEAADEVRPRCVRLAGESRNVERLSEVAVDYILGVAKMDVDRDRVAHPVERLGLDWGPVRERSRSNSRPRRRHLNTGRASAPLVRRRRCPGHSSRRTQQSARLPRQRDVHPRLPVLVAQLLPVARDRVAVLAEGAREPIL